MTDNAADNLLKQLIFQFYLVNHQIYLYLCSPVRKKRGSFGEMGEWLKPPVC